MQKTDILTPHTKFTLICNHLLPNDFQLRIDNTVNVSL